MLCIISVTKDNNFTGLGHVNVLCSLETRQQPTNHTLNSSSQASNQLIMKYLSNEDYCIQVSMYCAMLCAATPWRN